MTWTAPITVATGDTFSAAQFNSQIRDNLLETMPAKAVTAGSWFTVAAANSVVERKIVSVRVTAAQQTSSSSYADLATVGPSVTVTTGASAFVWIAARMRNVSGDGRSATASFAISGSTNVSAFDDWSISTNGIQVNNPQRAGCGHHIGFLTPGTNTFTMKYKTQSGYPPAEFEWREIVVMPF